MVFAVFSDKKNEFETERKSIAAKEYEADFLYDIPAD